MQRLTESIERLVQLYEATDRADQAANWSQTLEDATAADREPSTK